MKTILVVEDHPVILELIITMLLSFGYNAAEAVDGSEALKKVQEDDFGLILMDIQLPGIDGLEVLKELKKDPETREIPVIALTAHAMEGYEERCLQAGFSGYVSKPIDIRKFKSLLEQFNS
ncbi:response regulator [Methanosarcina sp. KYL-1]|uniref:response regulator n=1 Tax=Methanosarcina sp. KYL-1 TaxID=2602068 RepID=UPI0021015996|nr:response regulator [Methanosarcina sp. KYL-1]MCQ1537071.1 response regulator [Methanosarcina sp. KYL-1]